MRNARYFFALFSLLWVSFSLTGQDADQGEGVIFLRNPSFEDMPRNSAAPVGWTSCGFPNETPPDVQPDPKNEFEVTKLAYDGKTYLGMVTRENETYESVGQLLSQPMIGGQCYNLRIHLARSSVYRSRSRITGLPSNYVEPMRLRIFGGYSICDRAEQIGTTALVKNYDWRQYSVKLEPEADYTHIILEVFYPPQSLFPENGNIILDNAQALVPMECEADPYDLPDPVSEEAITLVNPETEIRTEPITERVSKSPSPQPTPVPQPAEPIVKLGATKASIREGQVFAVENISFKADSPELESASESALEEIVGFLRENANLVVEIGGHASQRADATYATELSQNRAIS
ncbi:MAG: OmpA family protein, partial [Bacteroidota bacterium]